MRVNFFSIFWVFFILSTLSGCATTDYITHYGIFTAENSAGEQRQFRIYWQTLRYEGWLENSYRAFPVVLETQCSERELRFYDASFGDGRRCVDGPKKGINHCASSRLDVDRRGLPVAHKILCGTITDRNGSTDILSLDGDVFVTLNCRPKITEKKSGGKLKNLDYLLGSSLPYVVSTKTIKGRNIDLLIPDISNHSSVCDPDS